MKSPLGILSPGFKKVGDYFTDMVKDLEANREEYGCKTPPIFNPTIGGRNNKTRPNKLLLHLQQRRNTQRRPRDNDRILLPQHGRAAQVRARACASRRLELVESHCQGASAYQYHA